MKQSNQGTNPPGASRSEAEIQALMKKYYSSQGISIKSFCEQHSIREWAFYTWHKRYRSILSEGKRHSGFIPVELEAAAEISHRGLRLFAEVRGIKIYEPVAAEYLKSLLS